AGVPTLKKQILDWLPQPYNNVVFFLRAFRSTPVDYRSMLDNMSIFNYFPEEENLPQDVYHILITKY
ncbi:1003_t:CDS:1, partial [Ambispora gerdemannii]